MPSPCSCRNSCAHTGCMAYREARRDAIRHEITRTGCVDDDDTSYSPASGAVAAEGVVAAGGVAAADGVTNGRLASTRVPSGALKTKSVPPSRSMRSRILRRPSPCPLASAMLKPCPLSWMQSASRSCSRSARKETCVAPLCRAILASASCAVRYTSSSASGASASPSDICASTAMPVRRDQSPQSSRSAALNPLLAIAGNPLGFGKDTLRFRVARHLQLCAAHEHCHREDLLLDGIVQVARQPVALLDHRQLLPVLQQRLELLGHAIEVTRQLPKLIARWVARFNGKIALAHGIRRHS